MREKQLIERNLPFNDKYQFVNITRGSIESGQVTACDNCGTLITNIVTVVNKAGKKFHIGTDCSETLLKATALKLVNFSDYDVEMYSLRCVNRFMTQARKIESTVVIDVEAPKSRGAKIGSRGLKSKSRGLVSLINKGDGKK